MWRRETRRPLKPSFRRRSIKSHRATTYYYTPFGPRCRHAGRTAYRRWRGATYPPLSIRRSLTTSYARYSVDTPVQNIFLDRPYDSTIHSICKFDDHINNNSVILGFGWVLSVHKGRTFFGLSSTYQPSSSKTFMEA
jgi:hypothetical protein